MVHCIYGAVRGYNFPKYIVFLSRKIVFLSANTAEPDEILHYAASGSSQVLFAIKVPVLGFMVFKVNTKIDFIMSIENIYLYSCS